MLYQLKRHPLAVTAHFDHCLVLTYAVDAQVLKDLLPPGLELDTFGSQDQRGLLAIAMVQTSGLRPAGMPRGLGQDFFLSGYRIFTRFQGPSRSLRGLRILRSDTDRSLMKIAGNLLTHYNYRRADVKVVAAPHHLRINIRTPGAQADLDVVADITGPAARLPSNSCFSNVDQARRFAGPLPYTFDYEPQTHSIIAIKAVRQNWHPKSVNVSVARNSFLDLPPFDKSRPVLASSFYLSDVPYGWQRGVRYPLNGRNR